MSTIFVAINYIYIPLYIKLNKAIQKNRMSKDSIYEAFQFVFRSIDIGRKYKTRNSHTALCILQLKFIFIWGRVPYISTKVLIPYQKEKF